MTRGAGEPRSIVENWVESRLWEGIDADDRELVLDVGLFEWMDAALLDEVLGGNDSMRRIQTMAALVGFLEPVRGGEADAWRLHPLIREHCALQRFRDARARFREVHRRIAVALARRGETLLALRHGAESGDAELAGDIVEEAGGIRLWLRHGLAQFRAAIELLDEKVLQARPRLRLARCAALVFAGCLEQAREAYRSVAAETHDEATFERWLDFCILRGVLHFYGGGTVGSEQASAAIADYLKIADCERAEPLVRALLMRARALHRLQQDGAVRCGDRTGGTCPVPLRRERLWPDDGRDPVGPRRHGPGPGRGRPRLLRRRDAGREGQLSA